ncbi:hypothetical protein LMG29542_02344 [Paraburkholderia humisilvae]|uniref:Uncharacterized protein n=1 Tax=Paraburkholderia humisilvae TaxID=627669 RepID=A0A6J5DMH7_9BURK|nr:hypothetical protein LMG29542_02344 [Paraburkholderia humisilvae]
MKQGRFLPGFIADVFQRFTQKSDRLLVLNRVDPILPCHIHPVAGRHARKLLTGIVSGIFYGE